MRIYGFSKLLQMKHLLDDLIPHVLEKAAGWVWQYPLLFLSGSKIKIQAG